MRKRWIAAFGCLLVLLCLLSPPVRQRIAKRKVMETFYLYREEYVQAAEPILAGDLIPEMELPGVRRLCRHRSEKDKTVWVADFSVDGWGIAPSSIYWGVYTTTDGEFTGFQGTDVTLTEDGNGWYWRQPGGDNAYYTEEIADGWYFYWAVF